MLPTTSQDREKRTSPFLWAREVRAPLPAPWYLTVEPAMPPVPGLWACSLGRLGLFLGLGWGSGAGFRCSNVNRRKQGQMAGGF